MLRPLEKIVKDEETTVLPKQDYPQLPKEQRLLYRYYKPQRAQQYQEENPIKIEDYNLGRITSVLGFFDPDHPNVIVVGKYLSPEEHLTTQEHETYHWRQNKTRASQREYDADSHARIATGINGIRYQMHYHGVNLRNAA